MRERGCLLSGLSLFGLFLAILILPLALWVGKARAEVTFDSFRAEMIDRAPYCAAVYRHMALDTSGDESSAFRAFEQQATDMYADYSLKFRADAEQDIRNIGNGLALLVQTGDMDEAEYFVAAAKCNNDLNRMIDEEVVLGLRPAGDS